MPNENPVDGKCNARVTNHMSKYGKVMYCGNHAGFRTDHFGTGRCFCHGGCSLKGFNHGRFIHGGRMKLPNPDLIGARENFIDEWEFNKFWELVEAYVKDLSEDGMIPLNEFDNTQIQNGAMKVIMIVRGNRNAAKAGKVFDSSRLDMALNQTFKELKASKLAREGENSNVNMNVNSVHVLSMVAALNSEIVNESKQLTDGTPEVLDDPSVKMD
ncbi:MAG: hypothetical protein BWY21_00280 [Parcubacteria group bacterium ADurb.Bin216]|nr:MAG: hypothetical protein BWY21_00280 [Parcubacteria group bacterium ADurb.Bin216]